MMAGTGVLPAWAMFFLDLLVLGSFASMFLSLQPKQGPQSPVRDGMELARQGPSAVFRAATRGIRAWQLVIVLGAFFYAGVNFFYVVGQTFDGEPTRIASNRFAIMNKGQVIREISSEEFTRRQRLDVRLSSGHWILFSVLPFLYFTATRKHGRDAE
jgi:hypothetical protein